MWNSAKQKKHSKNVYLTIFPASVPRFYWSILEWEIERIWFHFFRGLSHTEQITLTHQQTDLSPWKVKNRILFYLLNPVFSRSHSKEAPEEGHHRDLRFQLSRFFLPPLTRAGFIKTPQKVREEKQETQLESQGRARFPRRSRRGFSRRSFFRCRKQRNSGFPIIQWGRRKVRRRNPARKGVLRRRI